MLNQKQAIAFDVDSISLASLREALPGWRINAVHGVTVASLSCDWNPGAVDLMIVGASANVTETLGLCRFLAFCTSYSRDSQQGVAKPLDFQGSLPMLAQRTDAPLLVLVPLAKKTLVGAALEAGAHSCLILPISAEEVASMVVHARAGNQAGRHTLNLERAQREDRWRDNGGRG